MATIADASRLCLKTFNTLCSYLNKNTIHEASMPKAAVADEAGRFRVWCGNLGAVQSGHASLDFRIRDSPIMHGNIWQVLSELQRNLSESVAVASGERLPYEQHSPAPEDSDSDSAGKDHTSEDSEDEDEDEDEDADELRMRLSTIHDLLNDLNKLAFKIRNPATRPTSLKATLFKDIVVVGLEESKHEQVANLDDDKLLRIGEWQRLAHTDAERIPPSKISIVQRQDCASLISWLDATTISSAIGKEINEKISVDVFDIYADYDIQHVQSLLRGLRTTKVPIQHTTSTWMVARLARAITSRRRQLRYWSRHAEKLGNGILMADMDLTELQNPVDANPDMKNSEHLQHPDRKSEIGPSLVHHSATDVSTSYKELPEDTDTQSIVSYASTTFDTEGKTVELPPPPYAAIAGSDFVSRSRKSLISAANVSTRLDKNFPADDSRHHVLQDLQAYMCTYENCDDPNRLYGSRLEWIRHEAQSHRKSWKCYQHPDEKFSSGDHLSDHLRKHRELGENQIQTMTGAAEITLADTRSSCPICFSSGPFPKTLQNHLANHLERISLFALPRGLGEESESSVFSSRGEKASSRWSGPSMTLDFNASNSVSGSSDEVNSLNSHLDSSIGNGSPVLENVVQAFHTEQSSPDDNFTLDTVDSESQVNVVEEPLVNPNVNFSAEDSVDSTAASIGELVQDFSLMKDTKSAKLPHGFMSPLEKRIQGVLIGKEKLPGYNDAAVKRTFAEAYTTFTGQGFRREMDKERRVQDLVLIFYSNAIKALRKERAADDSTWKNLVDRHVALFVRLISNTLKDHGNDKDRPKLMSGLATLEKKLLTNDEELFIEKTGSRRE
ncbi:hypothetical protein PVAG01_04829 [Phlyctema vagabunda]|uniref:Uncharacterized protein n=1 Tax=Phlyctema vagabunda TaxID=108571 RepID=A0ABR4PJ02_9HELO